MTPSVTCSNIQEGCGFLKLKIYHNSLNDAESRMNCFISIFEQTVLQNKYTVMCKNKIHSTNNEFANKWPLIYSLNVTRGSKYLGKNN